MRTIHTDMIRDAIAGLFRQACVEMSDDMREALQAGVKREEAGLARNTILRILDNAEEAQQQQIPTCQDTGLVVVFTEVGQDLHIEGTTLQEAINAGVRRGHQEGFLRASIAADPIQRGNTGDNTPAVVHTELVEGDRLKLQLLAKGGGAENMSRFRMLKPADGREGVIDFVLETAVLAGPNACPPLVVGVGIGGSFDYAPVLAKRALLRRVGQPNPQPHIAEMERELLEKINASGIGPQGYGGQTTALAVQIEARPCHLAALPVSVNLECHAHRHREAIL